MTRRRKGLRAPSRTGVATLVLLGAFFLGSSCRTVGPRVQGPQRGGEGYDLASLVPKPSIRVGVLLDGKRAELSADSGVTVWLMLPNDARVLERKVKRATFGAARLVAPVKTKGVRLLETGDVALRAGIVPVHGEEALALDGTAYRGAFEVRPADGGVHAINVLGVEDYLRGVVPNELSPHTYGQLEALKAQAVAARTYAIRNMGRFAAQGYDICATPACQVYKGRGTENALSDRAVAETRGVIATSGGDPINAVYTSTCGGHTEDGENVFEGVPVSYLRGVACPAERGRATGGVVQGRAVVGTGNDRTVRDVALLEALGVWGRRRSGTGDIPGVPSSRDIEEWTSRAVEAAGGKPCGEAGSPGSQRSSVFRYVATRSCLADREQVASTGRRDQLVALESGGAGLETIARPDDDITRAEMAGLLAGVVEKLGSADLVRGAFASAASGRLALRRDVEGGYDDYADDNASRETFVLPKGVPVFRRMGGDLVAVSRLTLAPGDPVTAVVFGETVRFLEVDQSPRVAADGSPKHYGWVARLTADQIAKAVGGAGNVGRVTRVAPQRLGVSGRVVSLLVSGDAGDVTLNGLRIRTTLGLKENLFVLDEERSADGSLVYVFTGNGWGHGVGLCQVGAYGLARGGTPYEKILKHYYTGISLTRAY